MTTIETVEIQNLPGVSDILADLHRRAFEIPWGADAIETLLKQPGVHVWASVNMRQSGESGHIDAGALGFLMARMVADETEILTLAVVPEARRRGVGSALVRTVFAALPSTCDTVFLEVDETNTAALALYRITGFREVGRRTGYYRNPGGKVNDAIVMSWKSRDCA